MPSLEELKTLYRKTAEGDREAIILNCQDMASAIDEDTERLTKKEAATVTDKVSINSINIGYARRLFEFQTITDPSVLPGFYNDSEQEKVPIIYMTQFGAAPQKTLAQPGYTVFPEYILAGNAYVPESFVLQGALDQRRRARTTLLNNLLYKEDKDWLSLLESAISAEYGNSTSWAAITIDNLRNVVSYFVDKGLIDETKIVMLAEHSTIEALKMDALKNYNGKELSYFWSGKIEKVSTSARDGDLVTTFPTNTIYFIYADGAHGKVWQRGQTDVLQLEDRRKEYLIGYRGARRVAMGIFDPLRFYKVTI